jgi:uncharacterized membrane protein
MSTSPANPDRPQRSHTPPGWSYDPSSWSQRLPLVGLALVGFGVAMYLSLYQWRVIPHAWDPFFASPDPRYANGSERILNTWVSKFLPVPDAYLGALGYLADAVSGVVGGRGRWRTMPWVVLVFGLFVGPLGAVSIALVVAQPVLFGAWCSLCLTSAAISVAMIGPAMDEVLASLQYLRREHDAGRSVWRAFRGAARTADGDGFDAGTWPAGANGEGDETESLIHGA